MRRTRCDLRTWAQRLSAFRPAVFGVDATLFCGSGTLAINTSNTSNPGLCALHIRVKQCSSPAPTYTEHRPDVRTHAQVAAKYPQGGDHRLHAGELANTFGLDHGFELLRDEVHRLADGRLVSNFLARKLAPED